MPRIVKPKNHTVVDMYRTWCAEKLKDPRYSSVSDRSMHMSRIRTIYEMQNGKQELVMNYTMFRLIIETFNKYAGEAVVEGHNFRLSVGLGYLHAARVERSFTRPKIDIGATMAAKRATPGHPAIYHISDSYCMIKWEKSYSKKIQNRTVYRFFAARKSLKKNFSDANKSNPVLQSNYKFYPYIKKQWSSHGQARQNW